MMWLKFFRCPSGVHWVQTLFKDDLVNDAGKCQGKCQGKTSYRGLDVLFHMRPAYTQTFI